MGYDLQGLPWRAQYIQHFHELITEQRQGQLMRIVHADQLVWIDDALPHRAGRISIKHLLEGEEGSPDNFLVALARESADFFSPRHRHPWDQVRYCLSGSVPVAPQLTLEAGEVGYFPEGVHYGPQDGDSDRSVLVLQFGGASGRGYLSGAQQRAARNALQAYGRFEGGVFHRERGTGPRTQDAYEAIWEQATGTPVRYAAGRYKTPILMAPDAFAWRQGRNGVRERPLGRFNELGVAIAFVEIAAGAAADFASAPAQQRILYVVTGAGEAGGDALRRESLVHLGAAESAALTAADHMTLFSVGMPLSRRAA